MCTWITRVYISLCLDLILDRLQKGLIGVVRNEISMWRALLRLNGAIMRLGRVRMARVIISNMFTYSPLEQLLKICDLTS